MIRLKALWLGRHADEGFTLIELMLALAIFSLIGISTTRQLQQLRNTKDAAFKEIDLYSSARAAINILRFDLSQSFHILYDDLGSENTQALLQNKNVPHTLFDGRKNELVFTSLSHRVYYEGRRECEQTEISYFTQQRKGSRLASLMKRESPIIDDNLYEGGSVYTILDNISSLKFQYWDQGVEKWVDDWSSDEGQYRDKFPLAVKVLLSVAKPDGSTIDINTQFKVAFPNNDPFLVRF